MFNWKMNLIKNQKYFYNNIILIKKFAFLNNDNKKINKKYSNKKKLTMENLKYLIFNKCNSKINKTTELIFLFLH